MDNNARAACVGLTMVLAVSLSGCTAQGAVPKDAAGPSTLGSVSIEPYSNVSAQLDFETGIARLPLDSISLQTPSLAATTQHTIAILTDRCMMASGFVAVSQTAEWSWYGQENRTFGQWDVEAAGRFGFGLDPSNKFPTVDVLSQGVEYNKKLPSCAAEATKSLDQEITFLQSPGNIDYVIYTNAYEQTLASAAGKTAISDRTTCMEAQDVVVDPDTGAPSDDYGNQSAEIQVKIASVSASCSVSTGAIQTLFNLNAQYQSAYIDQSEAQVSALKDKKDATLKKLESIIAGAEV